MVWSRLVPRPAAHAFAWLMLGATVGLLMGALLGHFIFNRVDRLSWESMATKCGGDLESTKKTLEEYYIEKLGTRSRLNECNENMAKMVRRDDFEKVLAERDDALKIISRARNDKAIFEDILRSGTAKTCNKEFSVHKTIFSPSLVKDGNQTEQSVFLRYGRDEIVLMPGRDRLIYLYDTMAKVTLEMTDDNCLIRFHPSPT